MRIPPGAIIARDKLTQYLLVPRPKNDKSRFLARAGFTSSNPDALETAIRRIIANSDAVLDRTNEYGMYYHVEGELVGVNGVSLGVVTVWIMRMDEDGVYRFVTLKPAR